MSNNTATPATDQPASTPAPASSSAAPVSTPPPASSTPPPASTPAAAPSSTPQPASSSPPPAKSSAPAPSPSSAPPSPAITTTAAAATSTEIVTSVVVSSKAGSTVVVVNTQFVSQTQLSAHPTTTNPTELQNASKNSSGGLSTGGKTAIAVVIPVVVVALLVLGALFFWQRRKQRKSNEDERRKEVEEYGYNPNHDPTLPSMAEDESGYRGWGNTQTSSNRKASTTMTSGLTYSDSNSNPGGYAPVSPLQAYSEANSNDILMRDRRETLDSDGIGALGDVSGAAPNSTNHAVGVRRGPSNASSHYSMADHSDHSGDFSGVSPVSNEYYNDNSHGYYQSGPYGSPPHNEPIIRDVTARRNTRIEKPSVFPQQGNSGIAQNF